VSHITQWLVERTVSPDFASPAAERAVWPVLDLCCEPELDWAASPAVEWGGL
jgi:hypothetical protein